MPPERPDFVPLARAGEVWREDLVARFPPYSEFSRASLEAWAPELEPEVAFHRACLWLRMTELQSGDRYVTVLGDTGVLDAVTSYLETTDVPALRLTPALVADRLGRDRFEIASERDHFDYVLDAAALAGMRGHALKHKRGRVNKLFRERSATAESVDLSAPTVGAEISQLYEAWSRSARSSGRIEVARLQGELAAMLRLIGQRRRFNLVGTAIRIGGRLVALSLAEIVHDGYAMLHFSKSLGREVAGAGEALMQATAQRLLSEGCCLINMQEDLGLAGLREAKLRYKPAGFLEKFRVALREQEVER